MNTHHSCHGKAPKEKPKEAFSLLLPSKQAVQIILTLVRQPTVVLLGLIRQAHVRIVADRALPLLVGLRARDLLGGGAEDVGGAATADVHFVVGWTARGSVRVGLLAVSSFLSSLSFYLSPFPI